MSAFIKWTQSKIEQFDSIASKALNLPGEVEETDVEAEAELQRMKEELKAIKIVGSSQIKDILEKQSLDLESKKSEHIRLKTVLKSLNEENNLLKEHLRNADGKMTRLARVNDELTSKLDIENQDFHELAASEQSEYQVSLLTEKIKRLAGLLKAEKLKTADAIQEKNSINAAIEENERQTREKILELEQELEVIRTESESLKASLEKRPRISMNSDNLNELSEKLQGKQRMIENLLNEKSALVLLLENEKNEKFMLMESRLKNRVTRQPLSQLGLFVGRRHLRRIAEWVDEGVREFTDLMEEVSAVRLSVAVYFIAVHGFLVYWLWCGGEGAGNINNT